MVIKVPFSVSLNRKLENHKFLLVTISKVTMKLHNVQIYCIILNLKEIYRKTACIESVLNSFVFVGNRIQTFIFVWPKGDSLHSAPCWSILPRYHGHGGCPCQQVWRNNSWPMNFTLLAVYNIIFRLKTMCSRNTNTPAVRKSKLAIFF